MSTKHNKRQSHTHSHGPNDELEKRQVAFDAGCLAEASQGFYSNADIALQVLWSIRTIVQEACGLGNVAHDVDKGLAMTELVHATDNQENRITTIVKPIRMSAIEFIKAREERTSNA